MTTETLALLAIVVTIVGWAATFFIQMASNQSQARFQGQVQHQLELLKEQFASAREMRQYLLPKTMAELQEISDWFLEGFVVSQKYTWWEPSDDEQINELAKQSLDEWKEIMNPWASKTETLLALIVKHDRLSQDNKKPSREKLGDWLDRLEERMPSDLTNLMWTLAESVLTHPLYQDHKSQMRIRAIVKKIYLAAMDRINQIKSEQFSS